MASETKDLKFKDAFEKLEKISGELSSDEKDVDELVEKVRVAADLIIHCKDILAKAKTNIDKIITEVEEKTESTTGMIEEVSPKKSSSSSTTSDDEPF